MNQKLVIKYFIFNYILAISSFEYFFRVTQPALYLLFPLVTLLFFFYRENIRISALKIIAPFIVAVTLQAFLYGSSYVFPITLFVRLLAIYFSTIIIGQDFPKIFVNSIKYIATYSIVLYVIQYNSSINNALLNVCNMFSNLGSDPSFVKDRPNFIIYAIQALESGQTFYRNSGPFWEPGLYVIFLNVALFLNMFQSQKLFTKVNILLIVNIISAVSTTGTIVLLLNFTIFYLSSKFVSRRTKFIWIVALVCMVPLIWALPFMRDKILTQFTQSDVSFSRFGAAVVHWNIIKDYPWVGMPLDSGKTFSKYTDSFTPNGLTEIFTIWGVFIGFIYYFFLYRATKSIMKFIGYKKQGALLFLIMVISLFSQNMGNRPIYIMFLFLPIAFLKSNIKAVKTPISIK